jgi:hypothetical protein
MNLFQKTNKLRGLNPRANYTDQATQLVGEVSAKFYAEGATWSAWRIPTAVYKYINFDDKYHYGSIVLQRMINR